MKSSTLHRSGLTRERMAMLENTRVTNVDRSDIPQQPAQARSIIKNPDLDVLYKSVEKTFAKATSPQLTKTPGTYLGIGFVLGLIVMFTVSLIVTFSSSDTAKKPAAKSAPLTVVTADKFQDSPVTTEEKYVVKSGDTLDKIAFRFYGKYDNEKIKQIQAINNISNPSALQIGQVIIVPVNK